MDPEKELEEDLVAKGGIEVDADDISEEEALKLVEDLKDPEKALTEEERAAFEEQVRKDNERIIVIPEEFLDEYGLPKIDPNDFIIFRAMGVPADMIAETIKTARDLYISLSKSKEDGAELSESDLDMMENSKKTLYNIWESLEEMKKNRPSDEELTANISLLIDSHVLKEESARLSDCVLEEGAGLSMMRSALSRTIRKYSGFILYPNKETFTLLQKDITNIATWYTRIFKLNVPKTAIGQPEPSLEGAKAVMRNVEKISIAATQFLMVLRAHNDENLNKNDMIKVMNGYREMLKQIEETSSFFKGNTEVDMFKEKYNEVKEVFRNWMKGTLSEENQNRIGDWIYKWSQFSHAHENDIASDEEFSFFYHSVLKTKSSHIREFFTRALGLYGIYQKKELLGIDSPDAPKMPENMTKEEYVANLEFSIEVVAEALISFIFEINVGYSLISYMNGLSERYGTENFKSNTLKYEQRKQLLKQVERYSLSQLTFWFWLYSTDGSQAGDKEARDAYIRSIDRNGETKMMINSYLSYTRYLPEIARRRMFDEYYNIMKIVYDEFCLRPEGSLMEAPYFEDRLYRLTPLSVEKTRELISTNRPDFKLSVIPDDAPSKEKGNLNESTEKEA